MFVIAFLVVIMGSPMGEFTTKKTWPTIEACEKDKPAAFAEFVGHIGEQLPPPPITTITAKCVSNPAGNADKGGV